MRYKTVDDLPAKVRDYLLVHARNPSDCLKRAQAFNYDVLVRILKSAAEIAQLDEETE